MSLIAIVIFLSGCQIEGMKCEGGVCTVPIGEVKLVPADTATPESLPSVEQERSEETPSKTSPVVISAKPTEETATGKILSSIDSSLPVEASKTATPESFKEKREPRTCPEFETTSLKERIGECTEEQCDVYFYLIEENKETPLMGDYNIKRPYPIEIGKVKLFVKANSMMNDESDPDEFTRKVPTTGGSPPLSMRAICRKGQETGQNINLYYCKSMVLEYTDVDASGNIITNEKYLFGFSFDKDKNILETKCLTKEEYWEDYWA